MTLKEGSLFSGYNGLGLGIGQVLDTELAWVSDIDKGACKILAHRYPDVPNHGDLTQIDWTTVEPVDIITGGFPCQDLSHAGKRAGLSDDTRSGLWSYMCEAIDKIRPRLVVAENVRGLLSAEALRPVEPCTFCVGDESDFDLRALGSVLADLADIGYDARWVGLRAADMGAPHGRFRVFLIAYPRGCGWEWLGSTQLAGTRGYAHGDSETPADSTSGRQGEGRTESAGLVGRSHAAVSGDADVVLLKTPTSQLAINGGSQHPDKRKSGGHGPTLADEVEHLLPTPTRQNGKNNGGPSQFERNTRPLNTEVLLLPTPAVNDMDKAYTPEEWDAWTAKMKAAHGNGNGHGKSLEIEAARLASIDFGQYAAAITRWESVIGRPAPPPTEPTGKGGAHRLSARFTEWMMGLPDGWITDVPGITRNEALKACGNGVVPQQAAAAIRHLLAMTA